MARWAPGATGRPPPVWVLGLAPLREKVQSDIDDHTDAGHDVSFETGPAVTLNCDPLALRHVAANLIAEAGGIGLGLTTVRSIVVEHGGEISLHNRPEGGLRVLVTLPIA